MELISGQFKVSFLEPWIWSNEYLTRILYMGKYLKIISSAVYDYHYKRAAIILIGLQIQEPYLAMCLSRRDSGRTNLKCPYSRYLMPPCKSFEDDELVWDNTSLSSYKSTSNPSEASFHDEVKPLMPPPIIASSFFNLYYKYLL